MYLCMRTTIDIPDSLMERAKKHKGNMTFRSLVISSLERTLTQEAVNFVLTDASVGSKDDEIVSSAEINQHLEAQHDQSFSR